MISLFCRFLPVPGGEKYSPIARHHFIRRPGKLRLQPFEGIFHCRTDFIEACLVNQYLDAGLVFVVPAAIEIVDLQNRLKVG